MIEKKTAITYKHPASVWNNKVVVGKIFKARNRSDIILNDFFFPRPSRMFLRNKAVSPVRS